MRGPKTVPLLGKEDPLAEARTAGDIQGRPIQTSGIVGSLSIYMMRDPSFQTFSRGLSGEDRYLDLWLKGDEWAALFLKVLECPDVTDVPRLPGEDAEDWERRYVQSFQRATPNLPLLARFWDLFIYVSFRAEEIEELRSECLTVQARTSDEQALSALTKLLSACEEASKNGCGLLFVPD